VIRDALAGDAGRKAELAQRRREQYKDHAPVFHRPKAGGVTSTPSSSAPSSPTRVP
jgi:hypothetical protein